MCVISNFDCMLLDGSSCHN